jgi:hypothetical protein
MELFQVVFGSVLVILQQPIDAFGHTVTLWQVMIFGIVLSLVAWTIGRFFD